jgi:hypothetical protein
MGFAATAMHRCDWAVTAALGAPVTGLVAAFLPARRGRLIGAGADVGGLYSPRWPV